MPENVKEYAGYSKLFKACEGKFAQQLAHRLAECYNDTHIDKGRPSEEPGFQNTGAEAIRLGYATLKSPEDYLNKFLETRSDKARATSSASLGQAANQEVPGQPECPDQQQVRDRGRHEKRLSRVKVMAPLGHRGLVEIIVFYYWRKAVISVLFLEHCWNDTDRPLGQTCITA